MSDFVGTTVFGITGGSGSGKTELVRRLQAHFNAGEISVLTQDNYYHPRDSQELDTDGFENFDVPSAFDLDAFRKDLAKLKSGQEVSREEYIHNKQEHETRFVSIIPSRVIVVEGLFIFLDADIRDQIDYKVFVHTKDNLKVIRRIRRDRLERNYPVDVVLHRCEHHVSPAFDKYIAPMRESADIVINNNDQLDKGVDILAGFIRACLESN